MSNAMRTSKRALASVAAAALGLALIPFIATSAQAANALTTAALDGPLRAGGTFTQSVTVTGTFDDTTTNKLYIVRDPSNPGTLGGDDSSALTSLTSNKFNIGPASAAGTYTVRVCLVAAAAANCDAPVVAPLSLTFSTTGTPTTLAIAPATQTSVPNVAKEYTVTARDAGGNVTQLASTETVTVSKTQTAGATSETLGTLVADLRAKGVGSFTAANDTASATATLTVAPAGALFTNTVSATLVNSTAVAAASVVVTSPVSLTIDDTNFEVPSGSASSPVTFELTRATDDTGVFFSFTTTNGTPASGVVAVGANGKATVAVTPAATTNNATVALVVGGGTNTVTFKDPILGVTPAATSIVTKPGTTVTLTGKVTDQFDRAVPNYVVIGEATAGADVNTVTSSTMTNAQGAYSVTFTGATAVKDDSTVVTVDAFSASDPTTVVDTTVTIYYTETGTVALSNVTLGSGNVAPANFASTVVVPFGGFANAPVNGTTGSGNEVAIKANAAIPAPVTYTATGGVLSTTSGAAWDAGSTSVTAMAGTPVYFFSLTAGTATVTATAGENSLSAAIPVVTSANAAYNIAITPSKQSIAPSGIGTVTLAVTDVFGNAVTTVDDTGLVRIMASGEVLLPGFQTSANYNTGADGTITVTFIAGGAVGQGILTATPATNATNAAWQANYTPPANAPAPVTSAAAEIGVGEAPLDPLILIEGSRDGRRINIEGATLGLAEGTEVYPFIRFPGQSGFTQGTAVRTVTIIDEDEQIGEFFWGRNTGKRTAVQFRDAAGLRSNTVTIEAR